jgi:hypothetical protein
MRFHPDTSHGHRPRRTTPRRGITLALALAGAACGPASGGDPELWTPSRGLAPGDGGAGGGGHAAGSTGSAGGAPAATSGSGSSGGPSLTLRFTTVSFGGAYAPENVGAVWINDSDGTFVKTLALWATKRVEYLSAWRAASADNVVDAITGATRAKHGDSTLIWDATGVDGSVVPDGAYQVRVEFTERNGDGPLLVLGFDKGSEPFDRTPADNAYFVGQSLSYVP